MRRRRVFYIPGYDPFPPRRYRELYRREGAAQAAVSGHELALEPAAGGWTIAARIEGAAVRSQIEVLVWSDLVQGSMAGGVTGTYLQLWRTVWAYVGSGALWRLMRVRRGPIMAAFYPVLALLLQLLLSGFAGWVVVVWLMPVLGWLAAGATALAVGAGLLRFFKAQDHRLFAHYLMRDFAWSAQEQGAYPPALDQRLAAFRARIALALRSDCDEVLVVGHSSGAHLAVSVMADLWRQGLPVGRPALGLLTLGHVVPMLSFLPRADRLRRDLHDLAGQEAIAWVDVTAPGDACCFALCDPVAVTGVAPTAGGCWPLVLSASFRQTLEPARWKALRGRFFRLHFQYLCAFDRPGAYDYFAITAGPQTLAQRFAGCRPSPGRIVRPLSPHRGLAP